MPNFGFRNDPHTDWRNENGRGMSRFYPEEQEALWLGILLGAWMGLDPCDMEVSVNVIHDERDPALIGRTMTSLVQKKLVAKLTSGDPFGLPEWHLSGYVPTPKALGLCSDLEERGHPAVRQAA